MPQYTKAEHLKHALGEYYEMGFRLEEPDDHFLTLKYNDKIVHTFDQLDATYHRIRNACQTYLTWREYSDKDYLLDNRIIRGF